MPGLRDMRSSASTVPGSGESIMAYLLLPASFAASRMRSAPTRCRILSSRGPLLSAHQSAATLCHLLRVSSSALPVYSFLVLLLMETNPLGSTGSSGTDRPPGTCL